jgi:Asp/Glu/hydantoin racemase
MRIKFLVPFPLEGEALQARADQLGSQLLRPGVEVDVVPVRNSCVALDSQYEGLLLDAYLAEARLLSGEEGYDAVVLDTVSDSGMAALRSRLEIPVVGPGQVAFHLATVLGQRFSVLTMWDRWRHFYRKLFAEYHLEHAVASVRALGEAPDVARLFAGKEEEMVERLLAEVQRAIEDDGADVMVLGSTTMHQAAAGLAAQLPCPVINPGPVAVKLAEALVDLGLSHSKLAYPSPQEIQDGKLFSLVGARD